MPVLNLIATEIHSQGRPTSGKPIGSQLFFTDELSEQGTNTDMGTHSGQCVLVRRNPDMWLCRAGWKLPNGDLVAGGLLDFAVATITVAIFGGTGAYKQARGQIVGDLSNSPPTTNYQLEIL